MQFIKLGIIWVLGCVTGYYVFSIALAVENDRNFLYRDVGDRSTGVISYHPDLTAPGVTLYTSAHEQGARLISADGDLVHYWTKPFSEILDKTAAVKKPRPDDRVYWRKAKLLENGDVLVVYTGDNVLPFGYGLVKLDKDSNVLWKFLEHVHHDVEIGEDGRVYTLIHEFKERPPVGYEFLPARNALYSSVVVLTSDGKVENRIDLFAALKNSVFFEELKPRIKLRLDYEYFNTDYLHANSVEPLTAAGARRIPNAKPGDILVSMRNVDTIGVIDAETGVFVWIANGPWHKQHDPDQLPNGNLLVFDNKGDFSGAGVSRVVEYDPMQDKVVWAYRGAMDQPLESFARAAQQPLENGNILITESDGGRIVEVTRYGKIAWEYSNPALRKSDGYAAIVNWAERVDADSLDFKFNAGS